MGNPFADFLRSIVGRYITTFSQYAFYICLVGYVLHKWLHFQVDDLLFYLLVLSLIQLVIAILYIYPAYEKMNRKYEQRLKQLAKSRCDPAVTGKKKSTDSFTANLTVKLPKIGLLYHNTKPLKANEKPFPATLGEFKAAEEASKQDLEKSPLTLNSSMISEALEGIPYCSAHPYINKLAPVGSKVDGGRAQTSAEAFRISLAAVTLVPFRAFSYLIVLAWSFIIARLILLGTEPYDVANHNMKPFGKIRSKITVVCKLLARSSLWSFGFFWINKKGHAVSSKEAPILVFNHISYVDSLFAITDSVPSPLGAAEYLEIPVVCAVVKMLQFLPVVRSSANSKRDAIQAVIRRCAEIHQASLKNEETWPQILTYAEGTCGNGFSLGHFKPGAFLAGVPVQPVLQTFLNPLYGAKHQMMYPAWCSYNMSIAWNAIVFLGEPFHVAQIQYLPVYHPSDAEKKDATLFSSNVRDQMSAALGEMIYDSKVDKKINGKAPPAPVSDHAFEDVLLTYIVNKVSSKTPDTTTFTFHQFHQHFLGLSFDHLKLFLYDFLLLDEAGEGRVSKTAVTQFLQEKTGGSMTAAQVSSLFDSLGAHAATAGVNETNLDWRQFAILNAVLVPNSRIKSKRVEPEVIARPHETE